MAHEHWPQIENLNSNPEAMSAAIENNIHGVHEHLPNISVGIAKTMGNAVGHLNSKIPRFASQAVLKPEHVPSDAQKEKFERHMEAANDPVSIMRKIRDGSLTNDHMETLQAIYPQLLAHMRTKLSEISPDVAKKLPHHVKKGLAHFMGIPLESSDLPNVVASNQMTYLMPQQMPSQQRMSQARSSLGGLSKLNVAKRSATNTDREETDQTR